jgi:signal transduction histidine kinase
VDLDDRLSGLLEIARAVGSTLDLDELLAVVMDRVTRLLGADRSTLFLVDERRGEIWSKIAQGAQMREIRLPLGTGVAGHVARTGEAASIADAYQDPRFNPDIDRRTGYHTGSILCVPLRDKSGRVMGVIQVLNKREGSFDAADAELLQAVAGQAALALENAQLYRAMVERNVELDILYGIERRISQAQDLGSLLDGIVGRAMELCGVKVGGVYLLDGESGRLERVSAVGEAAGNEALVQEVARSGAARSEGGVLAVPVLNEGELVGVLELAGREGGVPFGDPELRLATLVAGQAGRAIQLGRGREEKERAARLAAVGQMISGVLHDLRTPMTVISGHAELMVGEREEGSRRTSRDAIWRQLEHVSGMTREILQFARGERQVLLSNVHMNSLLEDVEQQLRRELASTEVQLQVREGYRGVARLDEIKFRRVVHNLTRNAVEAMKGGGTLLLEVERDGADLVLRCSDTGPGIPPALRERLFDPFVTGAKPGGTGLGLAVVKKIVEDHGGSVACRDRPGGGTTFEVRLPQS